MESVEKKPRTIKEFLDNPRRGWDSEWKDTITKKIILGEKKLEDFQNTSDKAWQEVSADIKEFRNFMSLMLRQLDERVDGLEERIIKSEEKKKEQQNTTPEWLNSQTTVSGENPREKTEQLEELT